ncbi:MAG: WD40 repeat domain-containing protein [Treponema sp.]|jgi:WD40 repeat protein|nr:WD40 repeat domain-containing protein [Treponema sp.]
MKSPRLYCLFFVVAAACTGIPAAEAQTRASQSQRADMPGGHRGTVNAVICDSQGRILSAGADGFLNIWDSGENAAVKRFQLSPFSIVSMILRPGKSQVAVIESDGMALYRISAWDYESMRNLFTLSFRDPVAYINYSGAGNFLLAARSGHTGVAFIHPETGEALESPDSLTGQVSFAATGRLERTMICYLSSGILSYWDLELKEEIRRFEVPSNIVSPALLGNNRFFIGFDSQGLVVLDAVSGAVILRERGITGRIITGNSESSEFVCISSLSGAPGSLPQPGPVVLYHLAITNSGRLETRNRRQAPSSLPQLSAGAIASPSSAALGTADGRVLIFNQNGSFRIMDVLNQEQITEAAASSKALAFLTGDSKIGFLPLDYTLIDSRNVLYLNDAGPYTSIASDPGEDSPFLLWQSGNTRAFPLVKTLQASPESGAVTDEFIDKITLRFPLRAVSMLGDRCLFLDAVGNLSVLDRKTGGLIFTYSAPGSQDAVFINEDTVILGRSAGAGNSPFLTVNIVTGETVPLTIPAAVGSKIYRGASGATYGGIISRDGNSFGSSLVVINTSNPSQSRTLAGHPGEDTQFAIAETSGFLASSLGGSGAVLYRVSDFQEARSLERSPGLPERILSGPWFIQLDTEGNISWHDPRSGRLLALFKLYKDEWVLERGGRTIRGRVRG